MSSHMALFFVMACHITRVCVSCLRVMGGSGGVFFLQTVKQRNLNQKMLTNKFAWAS